MALAPSDGTGTTANPAPGVQPGNGTTGISEAIEKAEARRHVYAIGIGVLLGGVGFFLVNKRMATNTAIIVGLVLAVVSYLGAKEYLPVGTVGGGRNPYPLPGQS